MRGKRAQKRRRIPEALGNRVCGVWPYVVVLVLNAVVHAALFLAYGAVPQSFPRLLLSFIFFIYPLYYVADTLWSLRPSVYGILSGTILINRKYYMNTVQREVAREALLPVTVSVPVYMESNEIIFQTLRESLAAVRRYRWVSGRDANVVVSDDGLAPLLGGLCTGEGAERLVQTLRRGASALTQRERKAAERILFYREQGIAFVARPQADRAGLFKKGSNLNYTLRLGNTVRDGVPLDSLLRGDGAFAGGYAEGDITTHEIILLLDKDSGVREKIIEAVLPEFAADEKLAYVQCATSAGNLHENYYTYATGHQINNLFHNIWPCKALQGFFVPLVGHNVFLRKSLLEKSGLWSENRVSEDYDKAICFYSMGYHGKYAQLAGLEFTECASRTFTEETGKQRRYAYGLLEMIFDGTIAPGKARDCDLFFMALYFFSVINQALLLPTVLLECYFGNIHLLWAGFLLCTLCFVFLPLLRGLAVRHHLPGEHADLVPYTLIIAVSFVGHSFSFLAGACRYLANKLRENRTPFPSTNVDQLGYSFAEGMGLLSRYIRRNPSFPVIAFLCLDRGIFLLTRKGLEPVTALTYGYILFCAVLVPVLLTPQLFSGFGRRSAVLGNAEVGSLKRRGGAGPEGMRGPSHRSGGDGPFLPLIVEGGKADPIGGDAERFLAGYREALQASLPGEAMPEELLADYAFESCLRKDPESGKELYLLRRRADGAKALLRITGDYREEDALEEARLLQRLDHPGIPKAYASYEQDGKRYLIREYIEGRTLFEIVSAGGILGARDIFGIALKLADILIYLHAQTPPIIHRDIKPHNIIVGRDGSIHLIDFGIARVHKEARRQDTSVILTLDYASPEQYGFEQTTPLSDIYSFGVLLLFLATGRTVRSGLEAQIVSNRLRNLIEQCLVFNPKARIQSAEEIRAYLLHDTGRRTPRQRRRLAAAAGLLVGAVCLSALTYGLGFALERSSAARRGYERGYEVGYTDGYDDAPAFRRNDAGAAPEGGTGFGNMAVPTGSFAASSEGLVFYIADGGIWRMPASGTDPELLVQDAQARALSCYNGWLYYSSGSRIMQANIYTLERDVLCEGLAGDLYVTEEGFYIRAEDGLYRLDAETGETTALEGLSDCESLQVDGESLYFINGSDRALYRSPASGGDPVQLADASCRSACLIGGDLLCSTDGEGGGGLIGVDADTGEVAALLEVRASMLNVAEDGICFLDLSDGTINRCSRDGRIRERVSGNRARDFNVAGGWIFYHNEEDGGRLWCVRLDGANDHPVPSGR